MILNKGKKIIFGIIIGIAGFFVVGLGNAIVGQMLDPEGFANRQAEREQDRLKDLEQKTIQEQPTEEQIEKNRLAMIAALANHQTPTSFEKFEPATVPSGSLGAERLKYRPYWLVGDEWDEKEWLGKISKSQDCVDAVTMINDAKAGELQNMMYRAWVKECVTLP